MANEYIEGALIGLDRILNERARKRELDRLEAKEKEMLDRKIAEQIEAEKRRLEASKELARFKSELEEKERQRKAELFSEASRELDEVFGSDLGPREKQLAVAEILGKYPGLPLNEKINFLINTIGFDRQPSKEVQILADEIMNSSRYEDLRNTKNPEAWEKAMTNIMEDYGEALEKGLITEEQLNEALKLTNAFGNFGDFISNYVPKEEEESFWDSLFGRRTDSLFGRRTDSVSEKDGIRRVPTIREELSTPGIKDEALTPQPYGNPDIAPFYLNLPYESGVRRIGSPNPPIREELSTAERIIESGGIIPIIGRGIKRFIESSNTSSGIKDEALTPQPYGNPGIAPFYLNLPYESGVRRIGSPNPSSGVRRIGSPNPSSGVRRIGSPNPQKKYTGKGTKRINERPTGYTGSLRDSQTEERRKYFNKLWKGRVKN